MCLIMHIICVSWHVHSCPQVECTRTLQAWTCAILSWTLPFDMDTGFGDNAEITLVFRNRDFIAKQVKTCGRSRGWDLGCRIC